MSTTESRTFPLGAVLTVTTGKFLMDDIGELYDLLNFMTGDNLMTHQLPRASEEAAPEILRQHPQLEGVEVPAIKDRDTLVSWLDSISPDLGSVLSLTPMTEDDHTVIDPLAELEMMRPGVPVITVIAPEGGDR